MCVKRLGSTSLTLNSHPLRLSTQFVKYPMTLGRGAAGISAARGGAGAPEPHAHKRPAASRARSPLEERTWAFNMAASISRRAAVRGPAIEGVLGVRAAP